MFEFIRKRKIVEIKSPVKGRAIDITTVSDEVFASKMVGDGIAFEPDDGVVYAPVDGSVINVFPTKHAIGIRTREGIEILIHVGIDTVNLRGEGFETLVSENQLIKSGEKIMTFNIDLIKQKNYSTVIPMVITNMEIVEELSCRYGTVNAGEKLIGVQLK